MFLHCQQLLLIGDRVGLVAQVLHAAFKGQTGLTRLVLRQRRLTEVIEELDVQRDQNGANFADPVLGFAGLQKAIVGSARYLAMQGFE